ncbi:Mariner Mos1 transposase, partial [Blattella germanica]
DNAPAHRANATQQFLRDNNFEVFPHAPYSPDLAPSDFRLVPTMKDTLRGRTFTSRAAIASAIFQWSNKTPREAFAAAMQSWCRRCEKYVRLQGDYVEK